MLSLETMFLMKEHSAEEMLAAYQKYQAAASRAAGIQRQIAMIGEGSLSDFSSWIRTSADVEADEGLKAELERSLAAAMKEARELEPLAKAHAEWCGICL